MTQAAVRAVARQVAIAMACSLTACAPPQQDTAGVERGAAPAAPAEPTGYEVLTRQAAGGATLTAVRLDQRLFSVRVVVATGSARPTSTAEQVKRDLGAEAVINGGYFSPEIKPLGLLISRGRRLSPLTHNSWPVLVATQESVTIRRRSAYKDSPQVLEALQCGPLLVEDHAVTNLKPSEAAERSAVGLDDQDRLLLVCTTRGECTLESFAQVLAKPSEKGGLGCRVAMNLDGGSSSQFALEGGDSLPSLIGVPTHLAAVKRSAAP